MEDYAVTKSKCENEENVNSAAAPVNEPNTKIQQSNEIDENGIGKGNGSDEELPKGRQGKVNNAIMESSLFFFFFFFKQFRFSFFE